MPIPKEEIPDTDCLFMRVHKNYFQNGEIIPGAFCNNPKSDLNSGMSTDWDRYANWQDTQSRGAKASENYGIISLQVSKVRRIPKQIVEHTPLHENPAHTDIFGVKDTEARVKFIEIYVIMTRPSV